jgi:hypothetical protein
MRLPYDVPAPIESGAIIRRPALPVLPPASRSVVKKPVANGTKSSESKPANGMEKLPKAKNGAAKPESGEKSDDKASEKPALNNDNEKGKEELKLNKPADEKDGEPTPADESKKKDGKMAYSKPGRHL